MLVLLTLMCVIWVLQMMPITEVAQEFVEFALSEGYGDWLGMAPER